MSFPDTIVSARITRNDLSRNIFYRKILLEVEVGQRNGRDGAEATADQITYEVAQTATVEVEVKIEMDGVEEKSKKWNSDFRLISPFSDPTLSEKGWPLMRAAVEEVMKKEGFELE